MSTAIQDILGPYIEQMIQEANKKGLEKGIEKGIEKGRNEEKINNIVDTFKAGLSLNGLAQAFHLSIEEVKAILREHNIQVEDSMPLI